MVRDNREGGRFGGMFKKALPTAGSVMASRLKGECKGVLKKSDKYGILCFKENLK